MSITFHAYVLISPDIKEERHVPLQPDPRPDRSVLSRDIRPLDAFRVPAIDPKKRELFHSRFFINMGT